VLLIPHPENDEPGDTVNVDVDVDQMARYAARLMEAGRERA
jgi:hypothetical protein